MSFSFCKYNVAGNDFILLDNRDGKVKSLLLPKIIEKLCHRHYGIGADGIMVLNHFDHELQQATMSVFNSDGFEAEMCANGTRALAHFTKYLNLLNLESNFAKVKIKTSSGIYLCLIDQDLVELQMGFDFIYQDKLVNASDFAAIIPATISSAFFLNTGVPHAVFITSSIHDPDFLSWATLIRNHSAFPKGTNVNLVQVTKESIMVRTFERGVENETYSCGTGIIASSFCVQKNILNDQPLTLPIKTKGGDFKVNFTADFISYSGQLNLVYSGTYFINNF